MAPGDEADLEPMFRFALAHGGPISLRYPRAALERLDRANGAASVEHGKAEVLDWGDDGCFLAFGTVANASQAAAKLLRDEGLHYGVVNCRFAQPLDREVVLRAVE